MNLSKILHASFFTPGTFGRWGLPIIWEGGPGTAKTTIVGNVSHEGGLFFKSLIASIREPSDFLGLPVPNEVDGKKRVDYMPPGWAYELSEAVRSACLLDEINTAAPAVQAALLRVVLEGVIGDFTLPPTVRFVACMNSTEEAAGGWDLAPPLANRFGHDKWDAPDHDDWADWLTGGANGRGNTGNAEKEEKRVLNSWASPWAKARGLVSAFIRRRPELLHKQPAMGDPKASKAWPSRRSWEMAARAHAGAEVHNLDELETERFMSAFVGSDVIHEFVAWRAAADLPDPADVLDGVIKWKHDPQRLDRTAAVLSACSALVAPSEAKKRNDRAKALWVMLDDIMKDAKDLAVPASRVLVRKQLANFKECRGPLKVLQPMLTAAGIRP